MKEPQFPSGEIMIEDPNMPGVYVRNPEMNNALQKYDEWVWNVRSKEKLKEINQQIEDVLDPGKSAIP